MLASSYLEAHRYDGAAIEHARREHILSCAVQPRDVAIMHDAWRYKFLTAPQLRELWWPDRSVQAADRRLLKLFRAGHLDRFRPIARRGSYPWTYHLGEHGHRLLQHAGVINAGQRHRRRAIYDFGHVLHEIQLNAWVLAYRRTLGDDLLSWDGETTIEPPPSTRHDQLRLDDDWSAEGLRDARPRPIWPDAVLEVSGDADTNSSRLLLIEYDRTRRVDKNYQKFRRYDAFLTWWWRHSDFAGRDAPPFVLFVCQDEQQRAQFVTAADRELTGHRWHPSVDPTRYQYVGREHILFCAEPDAHAGVLEAWRLPAFPPGHQGRTAGLRRVRIAPTTPPDAHTTVCHPTGDSRQRSA
jgi:hypothetical protein